MNIFLSLLLLFLSFQSYSVEKMDDLPSEEIGLSDEVENSSELWDTDFMNDQVKHYVLLGHSFSAEPINGRHDKRDSLGKGLSLQYKLSWDITMMHFDLGVESSPTSGEDFDGYYLMFNADASIRFLVRNKFSWSAGGALAFDYHNYYGRFDHSGFWAFYGGITNFIWRRDKKISYVASIRLLQNTSNNFFVGNISIGARF